MKLWPIAVACVSSVLLATGSAGAGSAPDRVGVVLKGLDNPFFVAMFEGVRSQASDLGVRVSVRAAIAMDSAVQATRARALVAARHDCYVLNPINGKNLVSAVRGVGRPIVNVDSPIDAVEARRAGLDIRTYIGTNDFEAGRVAGAGMVYVLHGSGEIAFVTGPPRNVNSDLRVSGFARAIQHTDLRVAARVSAGYERTKAQLVAAQLLRTHPRIRGFFAVNDLMALGIADALSAAGRTGQVKVIGVDGIPEALDAVRAGAITATVSQYPYVMGQMAIEACAAVTHGADVPRRVDAPIQLVTTENAGRAVAAFPRPIEPYADPFKRLVRRRP